MDGNLNQLKCPISDQIEINGGYKSILDLMQFVLCTSAIYLYIYNQIYGLENSSILVNATALYILILSSYLLIMTRKNWYMLLISLVILYSNYSVVLPNYLFESKFSNPFITTFAGDNVRYDALNIMFLFMIALIIIVNPLECARLIKKQKKRSFINNKDYCLLIVIMLFFILAIILFFGFGRPIYSGERGDPTAVYEYGIILFIIAFHYSGNRKSTVLPLSLLLLCFGAQNFIFGGRITAVQLILVWFIVLYSHKVSWLKMFIVGIILFLLLVGIGLMRQNIRISFDLFNLVMRYLINNFGTLDTSYASYYASMTFLKTETFISFSTRFAYFIKFILSMLFGGSMIPDSNLATMTSQYYTHYGGGLLPFHFHFYMGCLGVIVSSFIVAVYMRLMARLASEDSAVIKCLFCYIAATTFRWYLYSPSQLIRGALLLILVYSFFQKLYTFTTGLNLTYSK